MNVRKVSVLLLIAGLVLTSSCKKYEDGPLISLRKRQKRVVNSWQYDLVYRNGLDVTTGTSSGSIDYSNSKIGFNDKDRFTAFIAYKDSLSEKVQLDGTWAFQEKDEELSLVYDNPLGEVHTWRLIRLKEYELWAEESFGDNLYEYQLKPTK